MLSRLSVSGRAGVSRSSLASLSSASLSSRAFLSTSTSSTTTSTSSTPSSADQPDTPPTKKSAGRRRRPSISLTNPRPWNRPVRAGVIPAYDEALHYIRADSNNLKGKAHEVRSQIVKLEASSEGGPNAGERVNVGEIEELERLKEQAEILEVQSMVNLPDVRWKVANGMADFTIPAHRHLVEQRWRREGALDLLMERIHQMHVVPDLLPSLHPSLDLRINFPEPPPKCTFLRTRVKRRYKAVEPGVFLLPEQTRHPPRMYTTVFHPEPRFYTLVMMDLDVPDQEKTSFTTYLHWLQPNISLSSLSPSPIPAHPGIRYIPPHPQSGTPYHRYILLLLPHADPQAKITLPASLNAPSTTPSTSTASESTSPDSESTASESGEPSTDARINFNLRNFCKEYGLDASKGGGAFMWREVWDETVGQIYRDTLKTPEPKYGLIPKQDPYAELKSVNKYAKY